MTKKKTPINKPIIEEIKPEIVPLDQEPPAEIPEHQIEEPIIEQQAEPSSESKVEPTPTAPIEVAKAEQKVEPAVVTPEPVTVVDAPTPKPKPLTLASLHAEIEELRQIILQLQATPIRQRKPPVSNGKVQIKDTLTGKIYPSKNNVYQQLLKAHELDDLVKDGVFGKDPAKNSFGCYNLFRAYPGRFEEIHAEVKDANTEIPQA